jgi:hypothetical protein
VVELVGHPLVHGRGWLLKVVGKMLWGPLE